MRDQDYTASIDFLKGLFAETLHKVELRACHNTRDKGAIASFDGDTQAFCEEHDVVGWGTYFGVCTRGDWKKENGKLSGAKDNVVECPALWVDIDCAKAGIKGDDALSALAFLPFPPSIIVNSGGGLHAYWVLEEAVEVDDGRYGHVEAALRQLALILAGDVSCAEIARIMRLPGTANSKDATRALNDGEPALCMVLETTGQVYDFETLTNWLAEQRAVLHVINAEPVRAVVETDPFVTYAREAGYEPSIDIDQALAAMEYGSIGPTAVHPTQLSVSASMIGRGYDDEKIVARILAATEAAAPRDAKWNWAGEERQLRAMIATGRAKGYGSKARERPTAAQPMTAGNAALKLVHSKEPDPEPEKKPEPKTESKSTTVAVGRAAIGVWADRYGPVMHTDGQTYAYEDGVWSLWNERLAQRLRAIIQEACAALRVEPKTALLGAAKAYFMDRPDLHRDNIEFDQHGLLIAADGALNLTTLEILAHSPEHFATRKVMATLNGSQGHPELDGFLTGAFSDRPEARAIISTVQEWFGAAIVPLAMKQRGQKKGLFVHGPSRSSKTQISELVRFLLGHSNLCGARMSDFDDRFGTEPLIGKYGWVADDAVGEGETLNADIFKVVVTGEQTSTKTKGGKNWEGRFGIPTLLTANNLFRVKDQSDAVYNRVLILPMTNVRPENAPEPAGFESIADKIGKTELTGLLWWAIGGWQRLAARGVFDPPPIMLEASQALKDDNNPVDAWRRECLELAPGYKILRADLLASMNGWCSQEFGVDAKPWSGRGFFPRLTKMIPGYSKDNSETADVDGNRLLIGVRLSKAGLLAWRIHKDSRWGEASKTSPDEHFVNKDHSVHQPVGTQEDRRPRF